MVNQECGACTSGHASETINSQLITPAHLT
jgi:hypothetical protein